MANEIMREKILNALQTLMEKRNIKNISVSEIAQTAGIGKGSIYYYFSSKEEIAEALIRRNYEAPLETAKQLAEKEEIPPFERMALIFEACVHSSNAFLHQDEEIGIKAPDRMLMHQKYLRHMINELKPALTSIISQGIDRGEIHFDYPNALAEIVLIVLSVKLDNSLLPSSKEDIERVIQGLVALLEKGTDNPPGSLNFLINSL